jgi:hypothetical protein
MEREKIASILTEIIGQKISPEGHPTTTVEKMLAEGREGSVCYDSRKLGRCYWEYSSVVLGNAEMPLTNGGRAGTMKDVMTDIGRIRLTTYCIDSGD